VDTRAYPIFAERRLATMLATVAYLEARSIDDRLELLDLLMTTELLGKAEAAADKERTRRHPALARHSARLAAAVEVLLEVTEMGEERTLGQVWESIRLCLAAGPDYGLGVGVICQCAPAQISASARPSVPTATQAAGPVHDRPAGWMYGCGCGGLGIGCSCHAAPFHDSAMAMMPPL